MAGVKAAYDPAREPRRGRGDGGHIVVEGEHGFRIHTENEAFRQEVRQFIAENVTPALQEELERSRDQGPGPLTREEFDLNLWYRRAATWTMKLGTAFDHRERIARALELA